LLTTNEEFAHFVAEGGYERREWWNAEGWTWRERENWTCPLYWTRDGAKNNGGDWRERTMFDEGALALDHPVVGISWYEAEAYARFMGHARFNPAHLLPQLLPPPLPHRLRGASLCDGRLITTRLLL